MYEHLVNRHYKISNFYMKPKLHKSKEFNEKIKNQNFEYLQIEGQPIVSGPVYYTCGIQEMLHIILEPSFSFIPQILKDF